MSWPPTRAPAAPESTRNQRASTGDPKIITIHAPADDPKGQATSPLLTLSVARTAFDVAAPGVSVALFLSLLLSVTPALPLAGLSWLR